MTCLHIHLDPLGGMAGDMFIAAMLDAFPDLEPRVQADLVAAGLLAHAEVALQPATRKGLRAQRLRVEVTGDAPRTGAWAELRPWLERRTLEPAVKALALALFARLAEAEAEVHGVAIDDVHFHEVADWDSVVDIVAAASVIVRAGVAGWSVGPVPLGRGRIASAHGPLPVPAPAVARLLQGFDVADDGIVGERVTPTGAVILRHLADRSSPAPKGRLLGTGTGAGSREMDAIANVVRLLILERSTNAVDRDTVTEIAFEIDDMTPEELAVALDHLRADDAVLDAGFHVRLAKKGRPQFAVRVLTRDGDAAAQRCFEQTSTLGVRLRERERLVLRRDAVEVGGVRGKRAERPGGATIKAESDDLAERTSLAERRRAAREVEHG